MLFISIWSFESLVIFIFFSTAALSPVNDDWFINKSLLSNKYKSAGITLPALKVIISPYTTFSCLISFCLPSLITSVNILIFSFNLSLNLYVDQSWLNLIITLINVIPSIIKAPSLSSVIKSIAANKNRIKTNLSFKASIIKYKGVFFFLLLAKFS